MGSSGRIGFELTKHYLSKKYLVIAQCFRNCSKLGPLVNSYGNIHILKHDYTRSKASELIRQVKELSHRLDAAIVIHPLFHQSDSLGSGSLDKLEEEINEVIKVNLSAPLMLIYGLSTFTNIGGSIVLLTDLLPFRGVRVYLTLKPSLIQLATSAALQSVISEAPKKLPKEIKYFAVATGWLKVPGLRKKDWRAVIESVPLKRAGEIHELMDLLDYLVEKAPQYLSGAVIRFSGGL